MSDGPTTNGKPHAARKPTCLLTVPSYGAVEMGAVLGILKASAGGIDVAFYPSCSSLLAQNFNIGWAVGLNRAHKGEPMDYFAMQHADIEPEQFWLDKAVAELEAKELDVLGVVSPLKDQRGLTSVAMGRPDGGTWGVHGRLTMHEVYKLPETFTAADLGHPLLINTGLWVCRFREEWARQVRFTINDRICFDPKRDAYFVQTEPEDWYVSRLFHELGLKVGCTRKVKLNHRGTMAFTNEIPWGKNQFDEEYLSASAIDARPPAPWFPHDVAGWLTEDEGRELARLAEGKAVLEVGAYCGRSTICLAQRAKSVCTIDTFDGRGTPAAGPTRTLFEKNLRRHRVENRVNVYEGESATVLGQLPPVYDLVFIDGSHDVESVTADIDGATAVLKPGGLLVFHDYGPQDPGVVRAVDGLVAGGGEIIGRCGTLAVVRPPAGAPVGG